VTFIDQDVKTLPAVSLPTGRQARSGPPVPPRSGPRLEGTGQAESVSRDKE